jgi:hypothetical protein
MPKDNTNPAAVPASRHFGHARCRPICSSPAGNVAPDQRLRSFSTELRRCFRRASSPRNLKSVMGPVPRQSEDCTFPHDAVENFVFVHHSIFGGHVSVGSKAPTGGSASDFRSSPNVGHLTASARGRSSRTDRCAAARAFWSARMFASRRRVEKFTGRPGACRR